MSAAPEDHPEDPREAQRVEPKSGKSDDPRVDPRPSPDDGAWENELTEEDLPSPRLREEAAETLHLDP